MEMDPLLFEESPRPPSSVMATFQAAESEAGLEEEIDAEPVVEPDPAHGDVNALHAAYVVQRDASDGSLASQLRIQSVKDALFSDLHNYLLRIFLQQAPQARLNNIDGGDIAPLAAFALAVLMGILVFLQAYVSPFTWLVIGLVIYYFYGRRKSTLRLSGPTE